MSKVRRHGGILLYTAMSLKKDNFNTPYENLFFRKDNNGFDRYFKTVVSHLNILLCVWIIAIKTTVFKPWNRKLVGRKNKNNKPPCSRIFCFQQNLYLFRRYVLTAEGMHYPSDTLTWHLIANS